MVVSALVFAQAGGTEQQIRDLKKQSRAPNVRGDATFPERHATDIALERVGGVMVYDVSEPTAPAFVQYVNNRDFSGSPAAGTASDLGPEGVFVIRSEESPTGGPLLVVSNEISGTITIYAIVAG